MRTRRLVVSLFVLVLIGAALPASLAVAAEPGGAASSPGVAGPIIGPKVVAKKSKPARDLPAAAPSGQQGNPLLSTSSAVIFPSTNVADPVAQLSSGGFSLNQLGNPIVNVAGQGGADPNDTNGDVGPNDYVQMINSQFRIFDKQGAPRGPAAVISSLWTSVNPADTSACATQNAGDPVVLYDNLADRWLLSQFAQTQFICVAISQTADPTGAYYLYQFSVARFPDYYKIGAWPDGYYVSANLNGPNVALAAVFDRANMLNGNPAGTVEFSAPTLVNNFDVLIPSDVDGKTNPPVGTPNFMYRQRDPGVVPGGGVDRLEVWEFHVDWGVPANSTFTGPTNIPTAPFDSSTCGYGFTQCVAQPAPGPLLDPIQIGTMFRFPYRNFGSKEVLVGNFTVDANGADGVGIRWFVLERSGGGAWGVANEGTYAPQPVGAPAFVHRWMGSAAMDRFGNLALGYTRSSAQNPSATVTGNPSAMYTGRLASDPAGLLPQPEITIQPGLGVTGDNRWGDYSAMTVDPIDDCTFWYTGDATAANGSRQSRIASFRFADCATDLEISKTVTPTNPNAGDEIVYKITVKNNGPIGAANVVVSDVLPAEVNYITNTDACTGVAVGASGTLTCPLGTIAAGASTSFEIKVSIDPDRGGTSITNTASVTSAANESDPADNTVTLPTLVSELADVRLLKECKPDQPNAQPAGTTTFCDIYVDNLGPSDARSVVITDTIIGTTPFTVTGITSSSTSGAAATCPATPIGPTTTTTITCSDSSLPAGARDTIRVTFTAANAGDVDDTASVSSATPDPNGSNNNATGRVSFKAQSDLALTKTDSPDPVLAGTDLTYTIQVTNNGPSTAANVVVKDTLPAQVSFVSSTPSQGACQAGVVPGDPAKPLTCNLGSLASAAPAATITVVVKVNPDVPAGTILVNNAEVSSSSPDPDNGNNIQTATTVVATSADLGITKTSDALNYKPSTQVKYQITVVNNGPSKALNVVVTDNLPDLRQAIYQSDTAGCVLSAPKTLVCNLGDMAVGQTKTFFIYVTIKGSRGDVTNTASVASSTSDPVAGNNASTRVVTIKGKL